MVVEVVGDETCSPASFSLSRSRTEVEEAQQFFGDEPRGDEGLYLGLLFTGLGLNTYMETLERPYAPGYISLKPHSMALHSGPLYRQDLCVSH